MYVDYMYVICVNDRPPSTLFRARYTKKKIRSIRSNPPPPDWRWYIHICIYIHTHEYTIRQVDKARKRAINTDTSWTRYIEQQRHQSLPLFPVEEENVPHINTFTPKPPKQHRQQERQRFRRNLAPWAPESKTERLIIPLGKLGNPAKNSNW